MKNAFLCDQDGAPACDDFCFCDLAQFSGMQLLTCEGAETDPGTQFGFCYVDATVDADGDGQPDGNPALLARCDASARRILRYMGAGVPASDALLFIACESPKAEP
jgi:hypothetical protein